MLRLQWDLELHAPAYEFSQLWGITMSIKKEKEKKIGKQKFDLQVRKLQAVGIAKWIWPSDKYQWIIYFLFVFLKLIEIEVKINKL